MTDKQDTKQPEKPKAVGYPKAGGFDALESEVWFHTPVEAGDLVSYWEDYDGMERGKVGLKEGRVAKVVERAQEFPEGPVLTSVVLEGSRRGSVYLSVYLWPGREPKAWGFLLPAHLRGLREDEDGPRYAPSEAIVPGQVDVGDTVRLWMLHHDEIGGIHDARVDRILPPRRLSTRFTGGQIKLARVQVTLYSQDMENDDD